MTGSPAAYVAALGASTPVGRDAWSSAAAVRAGISGFSVHPSMVDLAGAPMSVAMAPWLQAETPITDRCQALLLPAIAQVVAALETSADPGMRVALAIGLPLPKPGVPEDLEPSLRAAVGAAFRDRFSAIAAFPNGHAAGLLAMHLVDQRIRAGAFDACIVAGVDSYLDPRTLEWLEANQQLHGAGRLNNAWGFIPGEGAGAVLVAGDRALDRLKLEPLARALRVGQAVEANRIKTQTVCVGEGLTAAFREALTALPAGQQVTDVCCDMNGEAYRADEFGFAVLRTKEAFVSASEFVAPADCWGDMAAASAPLGVMLATIAGRKGYASGPYALVWASSEDGTRGATLLQVAHKEGR